MKENIELPIYRRQKIHCIKICTVKKTHQSQ